MGQQPGSSALEATRPSGWLTFAAVMIAVAGALNVIDGLVALYHTSVFRASFLFGDLRTWSFVFIVFGAVQIAAGLSIYSRRGWARWFGLAMVSINAFVQLFVFGAYPFFAATIIAYDAAVFYALSVHWQRRYAAV